MGSTPWCKPRNSRYNRENYRVTQYRKQKRKALWFEFFIEDHSGISLHLWSHHYSVLKVILMKSTCNPFTQCRQRHIINCSVEKNYLSENYAFGICLWFDKLIFMRQDKSKIEFLRFINQPIPTLSFKAQPIRLCSPMWLATPSAMIGATNDARKRALTLQGSPFSMAWMDTSCLAMALLRSFRWRHMSHPDSSCQPPAERPGHSAHDYYRKKQSSAAKSKIELA